MSRSARLARLLRQGHGPALIRECAADELQAAAQRLEAWQKQGFHYLTLLDEDFPGNLQRLEEAPAALFIRGALQPRDERAVAIVGTRQASEAGRKRAARLASELARAGVTIVSGLARGIDTAAHAAALAAGGRTLAVLGTGLSRSYPAENRHLQEEIATRCALLSLFAPDFTGTRYSFPMRNHIISGLARASVVVEAAEGSGAHQEARSALKQERDLWLLHSLVEDQDWARRLVDSGQARVLRDTGQLLAHS